MWWVRKGANLACCSLLRENMAPETETWGRGWEGARMGEPLRNTKISCLLLPAGGSLGWRVAGRGLGLNGGEIEMLIKNTLLEGPRPWV